MKTLVVSIALAATLALATGCSEDVASPEPGAPDMPPAASLQLDLALFDDSNASRLAGDSHSAFLAAVFVADIVKATMIAVFAPPALAFQTAASTTPVQQEDGSWLWTYSWSDSEGREVGIELQAWVDALSSRVDWELRVSDNQAEPPLENVVWFTGESSASGDSGHWIFHDLNAAGGTARGGELVPVVRVDWNVEDQSHRSLVITLIDQADENVGDSLSFAVDATVHSMTFVDASEEESADVTWDALTGAGSILWPGVNEGVRACWDTLENHVVDIACP